ncbi:MAG: AlpA family phage regulatory protein [Planctomycetia bacterium]|nr:AlpA family phage regulatory protein [Planctomycetia bacterium]
MEDVKNGVLAEYVRPTEAAKMFGVGLRTIYFWRNTRGDFPKPVTLGRVVRWRVVRWRVDELRSWFENQRGGDDVQSGT